MDSFVDGTSAYESGENFPMPRAQRNVEYVAFAYTLAVAGMTPEEANEMAMAAAMGAQQDTEDNGGRNG